MKKMLFVGICLSMCSGLVQAVTTTVGLNQALEITFRMPAVTRVGLDHTDTAYLAFSSPTSGAAVQATATLYDGNRLLGSNGDNYGGVGEFPFYFYWTQTGSNFNSPQATLIDASSLIDRSIQGRIVVIFNGGFSYDSFGFGAGNGFNSTIITEGGNAPSLTGLSVIAVPEPKTYGMMLASLGLVRLAVRRRRRSILLDDEQVGLA